MLLFFQRREDIHKYAISLNEDNLCAFIALQETCVCKARKVYDVIDSFVQEFENLGYKNTEKHNAAHVTKCLYAFLAVNNLNYNIGIAELWYRKIAPLVGSSYHAWIRIINLFDSYIQMQKFDPLKLEDIDFERKTALILRSKGDKDRLIYIANMIQRFFMWKYVFIRCKNSSAYAYYNKKKHLNILSKYFSPLS